MTKLEYRTPPTVVFTALELAGLLSMAAQQAAGDGQQAVELTRSRLGLGVRDAALAAAGLASLADRGFVMPGLATDGQTGWVGVGAGAVLGAVFGAIDATWTRIVHGDPDGTSGGLIVDASVGSVGITPQPDRTFAVTALPPGMSASSVIGAAVLPFLDARAPGIVQVVVWRSGGEAELMLSRDPAGRWWRHTNAETIPADRCSAAVALGELTAA